MTDSEFDDFSRLLADVQAFYRRDASAFALGAWWAVCRRFPLAAVRAAFTAHSGDPERGQFAPYPADIVRLLEGRSDDRALVAWGRVLEAIARVGHYQSIEFGDRYTHAAIRDLGGWPAVCTRSLAELDFTRRRFCESYRAYVAAGGVPVDTPRRLAGEHETTNAALGYTVASEGPFEPIAHPRVPLRLAH